MLEGSYWFKRFVEECGKISSHIKFKRIKHGFYRMYWQDSAQPAYLHECYKWMPRVGYDIEERDPRYENFKFYEEYEDQAELTMKVKNYVEGFFDSLDTIRKRVYMLRNDKEFRQNAINAYKEMRVK